MRIALEKLTILWLNINHDTAIFTRSTTSIFKSLSGSPSNRSLLGW